MRVRVLEGHGLLQMCCCLLDYLAHVCAAAPSSVPMDAVEMRPRIYPLSASPGSYEPVDNHYRMPQTVQAVPHVQHGQSAWGLLGNAAAGVGAI